MDPILKPGISTVKLYIVYVQYCWLVDGRGSCRFHDTNVFMHYKAQLRLAALLGHLSTWLDGK